MTCLFAGYLLLYLFHVHGYYQVHGTAVLPYETLRFSMNVMTLYSLLAGAGVAVLLGLVPGGMARWNIGTTLAVVLYACVSFYCTIELRDRSNAEEYAMRIDAAQGSLAMARQDAPNMYVVTLEPLVVQIFGSPEVKILGLYALNSDVIAELSAQHPTTNLLFVDQAEYGTPLAERRYASALRCLDRFPQKTVLVEEQYILKRVSAGHASR